MVKGEYGDDEVFSGDETGILVGAQPAAVYSARDRTSKKKREEVSYGLEK